MLECKILPFFLKILVRKLAKTPFFTITMMVLVLLENRTAATQK